MTKNFLQLFADGEAVASAESTVQSAENQETQAPMPAEEPSEAPAEAQTQAESAADAATDEKALLQLQRIAEGRMQMQSWMAQAEALKEFYPSLSFRELYNSNENFAQLLRAGVSVRQAYEVTHLPQILTCAMQYAARKAAEKTANAMRNSALRPQENGLSDRKAGLPSAKNVNSLTQTDIIRILERVGKGDKITF